MGCFLHGMFPLWRSQKTITKTCVQNWVNWCFRMETILVPGCTGPWSAVALASRALLTPSTYCCTLDRGLASEFSFLAALQRSEADALRLRWHMNLYSAFTHHYFCLGHFYSTCKTGRLFLNKNPAYLRTGQSKLMIHDSSNHQEACGIREWKAVKSPTIWTQSL